MVAISKASCSSEFSMKISIVCAPLSLPPLVQRLLVQQLWQLFSSHTVHQNSARKFLASLSLLPLGQKLLEHLHWHQLPSQFSHQNSGWKFLFCWLPCNYFPFVRDCSSSCYGSYFQLILSIRIQQENLYCVSSHVTTSIVSRTDRAAAMTGFSMSYSSSEFRMNISIMWLPCHYFHCVKFCLITCNDTNCLVNLFIRL